jgi:hypothetical protein
LGDDAAGDRVVAAGDEVMPEPQATARMGAPPEDPSPLGPYLSQVGDWMTTQGLNPATYRDPQTQPLIRVWGALRDLLSSDPAQFALAAAGLTRGLRGMREPRETPTLQRLYASSDPTVRAALRAHQQAIGQGVEPEVARQRLLAATGAAPGLAEPATEPQPVTTEPQPVTAGAATTTRVGPQVSVRGGTSRRGRLTPAQYAEIRAARARGETLRSIARRYGIVDAAVDYITRRAKGIEEIPVEERQPPRLTGGFRRRD